MSESNWEKLILESGRWSNYWQSLLRVGVPFVILYRGTDYLIFRVFTIKGGVRLSYSWISASLMDIPIMFLVATLWWLYWRQIARKRREQDDEVRSSAPLFK
jgi:hypothetical protein